MKVLFITPSYYPSPQGGSERSLKLLVDGLIKKNISVSIISFDGTSKTVTSGYVGGANVFRIKKLSWKPKTLALNMSLLLNKGLIKKERPDIIHIYNTWHIPSGFFIKKYAPVIATLNNYYPICATSYTKDRIIELGQTSFPKLVRGIFISSTGNLFVRVVMALGYSIYTEIYRPLCKRINFYIAYADAIKKIYAKNGFDKNKIFVISSFFEKKQVALRKNKKRKIALYVAGPYESKGFLELLRAITLVKDKAIEFRFIGATDNSEKITEFLKQSPNIRFYGWLTHKEVQNQYRSASVLIHPAQWPEPFSRTWIEALTYGLPIISSDHPVAKDVLKNAAIFYKRGHPEELADKISRFFDKKETVDINLARKELFSKKPIEDVVKLYNQIIQKST
jgi:glycosyltransferase involved in cell wall biosynthesis